MLDKNSENIQIGDIVKIEKSPIKSDNGLYVVVQDGTSKLYRDTVGLTMYKVVRIRNGGYSLSKAKYNIGFFPLTNFSNKYKYSREEMDAATIEIIVKAKSDAFKIVKKDGQAADYEHNEKDSFFAIVSEGENKIEDTSYLVSQSEKMTAFFSNLSLRKGQKLEIVKHMHNENYNWYGKRGHEYELLKIEK